MRIQRLDLGVDIVVVPDQDLVIVHPDLSFGQAMGAIMAALPDLHPDLVANLVSQVSQRPREMRSSILAFAASVLIVAPLGFLLAFGGSELYDRRWHNAIAALEFDCKSKNGAIRCIGPQGSRFEVAAYQRDGGVLYVLRSEQRRKYVRAFDGTVPQEWLKKNPDVTVLSKSTATWG